MTASLNENSRARVALITGTSSGIGRTTALHLARNGYRVLATMRDPDGPAEALRAEAADEKLALRVLRLDVNDPRSVREAVAEARRTAGRVDILVNNAGISAGGSVEETSEDALRAVFETNFFGAVRLMRAVLPEMRRRRSGAIVNVTSIAGRLAVSPQFAYAASKWALEAASEILAQEVRRFRIRVALIEPGVVLTPIFDKNLNGSGSDSPYAEFSRRFGRVLARELDDPLSPEVVAETIQEAIETDRPRLRWPVGEDAERWLAGRGRMTDEEWVDAGRRMSAEEFAAFYRRCFGVEL